MDGGETRASRAPRQGWLVVSLVAALGAGVIVAVDGAVALPEPIAVTALVVLGIAVAVFGGLVWREARTEGAGVLRTAGRVLARSIRVLWLLLFG